MQKRQNKRNEAARLRFFLVQHGIVVYYFFLGAMNKKAEQQRRLV
jgi:hypothetical protein